MRKYWTRTQYLTGSALMPCEGGPASFVPAAGGGECRPLPEIFCFRRQGSVLVSPSGENRVHGGHRQDASDGGVERGDEVQAMRHVAWAWGDEELGLRHDNTIPPGRPSRNRLESLCKGGTQSGDYLQAECGIG